MSVNPLLRYGSGARREHGLAANASGQEFLCYPAHLRTDGRSSDVEAGRHREGQLKAMEAMMTAKFCNTVRMVALLAAISLAPLAQAQPIPPSPQWTQAMPAGPAVGVKMTEEYVKQVGRIAYLWAWPMANLQSRL